MSREPGEKSALEQRSKALFDAGVDGLDANVRSRLARARHAAVEALEQQRRPRLRFATLPAAGGATVALAVCIGIGVSFFSGRDGDGQSLAAAAAAEDMELLADADNLELIEDMDFYAWLDGDADADDGEPIGASGEVTSTPGASRS